MTDRELIAKADRGEGLTVEEIMRYQKLVPPQKHVYGKYGTLAKIYLEEHCVGKYWTLIADGALPEYLHKIDEQAEDMYDVIYEKLSKCEQYERTGDYMTDVRRLTAMQQVIEEEILSELVYVG